MRDMKLLGKQAILRVDHVVVVVVWKFGVQSVGRLARLSVANVVGEHNEVFRAVQQLARAKQLAAKLLAGELRARSASAVHDQHRGLAGSSESAVVDAQF